MGRVQLDRGAVVPDGGVEVAAFTVGEPTGVIPLLEVIVEVAVLVEDREQRQTEREGDREANKRGEQDRHRERGRERAAERERARAEKAETYQSASIGCPRASIS